MTVTFKKAVENDAELLLDIYNRSFYDDYKRYGKCPGYGKTKEQMINSIKRYAKYIIICDGIAVGAISFDNKGNGNYYIGCLCVVPEFQRRGIGSKTFRFMISVCKDWKCIELVTPADKEKNIKFYTEKCGFNIGKKTMDGNVEVINFYLKRN